MFGECSSVEKLAKIETKDIFEFSSDGLEDPLDDVGLVQQQLEQLSVIERCEYEKTCALLVQLFDQTAGAYQETLSQPVQHSIDLVIQEGQLTWLVYIIGSAIGGRLSFTADDEHDIMDGELVVRVRKLRHFLRVEVAWFDYRSFN